MSEYNLTLSTADLRVYPESGLVKNDTSEVRLGPVNMRVLTVLIEQSGKVVSRSDLFDCVWKNQIVSDDVLTRCISDLRAQLGPLSKSAQLIETLPKRGYRWLPEVSLLETEVVNNDQRKIEIVAQQEIQLEPIKQNQLQQFFIWLTAAIVGLLLISTSFLWIVEQMVATDLVRVALIPIEVSDKTQKPLASELEDLLRKKLFETKGLRFLAQSAVASRPQNPYPYFAHEFATRWLIEGQVRAYHDKYRLSLSLVDARTATVYYSLTEDIENTPVSLNHYCELFIQQMSLALKLNQE